MSRPAANSARPLYTRLAAQAARTPDALALQAGERALSYRELLALADHTAQAWQAQGLGEGSLVGWLGHNTPEMLAALLACARLGAVWVPLNWRLAAPELAAIARHAGLSALLNTPDQQPLADAVRALAPCAGPQLPAQPGDAMLVYTSGTTGQPKGALHTQAGLCANIDAAISVQGLVATDRVLAVLPMFHVGGLCIQVLPALACGATVLLQPRFEAGAWLRAVASARPSVSLLVPAAMQAVLAHPGWPVADLSALRFVNSGSQVVPLALIEAFHARGLPVSQVYGCTETGPVSLALRPEDALAHPGSVGRPAPGVRLRLMAAPGRLAAAGEVGEIQLQAPNLMRAYHRQAPGSGFCDGWFATGDLARQGPGGWVSVVGRSTDLIISGGENIFPAEIENLASRWPGVADACVVGLPDARWGEVPVLVLVAQPGRSIDVDGLRALCQRQLAGFKQPRRILLQGSLPRTALGKLQKAVLVAALWPDLPAPDQ